MTGVDIDTTQFSVSGVYHRQPPPLRLMTIVDHYRDASYITAVDATSLRVVELGETEPAASDIVKFLVDATGLSTDRLAYALGASRRSLFNWRQGRPMKPDLEARVKKASFVVGAVVDELAPASVKGWLEAGDPPAIDLMHKGLWAEIEERVNNEARPIRLQLLTQAPSTGGVPESYGSATHAMLLQAFTTPREVARQPTGWRPREHTGLGDEEIDGE